MPPNGTSNANLNALPIHTRNANPRMSPADSSNVNLTMASIDTSNANPQKGSPLFTRIPGEIRDHIFDLALTAYSGKKEPFAKDSYYYRPGFRYADQKLDTALLRTCRRIYQEARLVPFENYERVEWQRQRGRGPSNAEAGNFARGDAFSPWLTSLHLFTQQIWLEDSSWRTRARDIGRRQNLRHLKITIRHRYAQNGVILPLFVPSVEPQGIALEQSPAPISETCFVTPSFVHWLSNADSEMSVVTGGGGKVLLHLYLMQNRRETVGRL